MKYIKVGVVIMVVGILGILVVPFLVDDSVYRDFIAKHGERYTIVKQLPIPVARVYPSAYLFSPHHCTRYSTVKNVGWDDFRAFATKKNVRTAIYVPSGQSSHIIYGGERVLLALKMRAEKNSSFEVRRGTFVFETEIPAQCAVSFTSHHDFEFDVNTGTIRVPVHIGSKFRFDVFQIGAVVFLLGLFSVMVGWFKQPAAKN